MSIKCEAVLQAKRLPKPKASGEGGLTMVSLDDNVVVRGWPSEIRYWAQQILWTLEDSRYSQLSARVWRLENPEPSEPEGGE